MNLITPINQLGYGIAGLNIAKALSKQCDLAVWAHGDRAEVGTPDDVPIIQELIGKRMVADFDRPCLKIWHQHDFPRNGNQRPLLFRTGPSRSNSLFGQPALASLHDRSHPLDT